MAGPVMLPSKRRKELESSSCSPTTNPRARRCPGASQGRRQSRRPCSCWRPRAPKGPGGWAGAPPGARWRAPRCRPRACWPSSAPSLSVVGWSGGRVGRWVLLCSHLVLHRSAPDLHPHPHLALHHASQDLPQLSQTSTLPLCLHLSLQCCLQLPMLRIRIHLHCSAPDLHPHPPLALHHPHHDLPQLSQTSTLRCISSPRLQLALQTRAGGEGC